MDGTHDPGRDQPACGKRCGYPCDQWCKADGGGETANVIIVVSCLQGAAKRRMDVEGKPGKKR